MSIKLQTAVWDHLPYGGGTLLVALKLADFANDDGTGIYPKQSYLAGKVRLTDRAVRDCLAQLEQDGVIWREGKRAGGVIEWAMLDPEEIAARKPTADIPGSPLPTEPSSKHQNSAPLRSAEELPTSSSSEIDDAAAADSDNDTSTAGPQSQVDDGNGNTEGPPAAAVAKTYAEPMTPGAAAAPWLVLELARLMRCNDPNAKLPAGLRGELPGSPSVMCGKPLATPDEARNALQHMLGHSSLKPWLNAARLLIDADGREPREVAQVLRWCQLDEFWKTNILSWPKLREKYPQLRGRALQPPGGGRGRGAGGTTTDQGRQLDALAGRR